MNRSEIFKKAHSVAKATVATVGNYAIAFSIALKEVYSTSAKENKMTESINAKIVTIQTIGMGAKFNTKLALERAEKYGAEYVLHQTTGFLDWLYSLEAVRQLRLSRTVLNAPKPTIEPVQVLTRAEIDNLEQMMGKKDFLIIKEFGSEIKITRKMIEFSRSVYENIV